MCGIILTKRYDGKDARKMTLKQYEFQKDRGQEGYGFVTMQKNLITHYERTEDEKGIKTKLDSCPCDEVLFHHRFPTSTPNFAIAAHPLRIVHKKLRYTYYIVHNGVVWNGDEFKENHEKMGFHYTTEMEQQWKTHNKRTIVTGTKYNDSEALATELAIDLDNERKGVGLKGSIAFVALQVDKTTGKAVKLFFGRNEGSPLKINRIKDIFLTVSSEGEGTIVPPHTLHELDYATDVMQTTDYSVGVRTVSTGELFNIRKGNKLDEADPCYPADALNEEENAVLMSLCSEYDNLDAELNCREWSKEEEDRIRARMEEIEDEIMNLEKKEEAVEINKLLLG